MTTAATIVGVSSRQFDIPLDCPCCGAAPDTEIAVPLARASRDRAPQSVAALDFPYCRFCVAHVARWESAGVILSGWIVIGVLGFAVAAAASQLALGITGFIAAAALGFAVATARRGQARRTCRDSCGSVGKSVAYHGWNGTATLLAFESISYGAKFAERNASRLVDDARIRRLLANYKQARIAIPTPAAAVTTIPPPLGVGEWAAKLATTPSRVARRSALAGALEMIADVRERDQLVRTVCAIELAAYVTPLDRIPNQAAKRRHLQDAIIQVGRDNIPDPLRQMLLRELEQQLIRI